MGKGMGDEDGGLLEVGEMCRVPLSVMGEVGKDSISVVWILLEERICYSFGRD